MLRASLRSARTVGCGSTSATVGHQWAILQSCAPLGQTRGHADKPSIADSKPIVLPGSFSSATNEPPPPGPVATSPSSKIASPATPTNTTVPNVPLTPPPPSKISEPPTSSGSVPPPPPPPKPRRFFRRFFTTIFLLTTFGFAGGVYYSRVNDNFHDFFTEYVPFGEDAVLYFEEREFRKRFPSIANRSSGPPRDTGDQVKIPSQSGVSWRLAEDHKSGTGGRHADATKPAPPKPSEAKGTPEESTAADKVSAVQQVKKESKPKAPKAPEPEPAAKPTVPTAQDKAPKAEAKPKTPTSFTAPEVDQPSRFPPEATRIDPLNIGDAKEPVVQDLVKIVNDIIAVLNTDSENSKYSSTISKAKNSVANVAAQIKALKDVAEKDAQGKIEAAHKDFDRGAKELLRRIQLEVEAQETSFKEEFENERQKIQSEYDAKLKNEIATAKEINEQRLRNKLLEQAVEMKRKFIADVKGQVEEERNGRLGKLSDLSNTVTELERLTTDWNSVVDSNLKTQHLHVAVEAVRSSLEKAQIPRPFIRELAALKEIASDDPVVNAAIASINPSAYQRGVPSSAQLIDRYRRVAAEVRKASLLPEDAGVASHASSWVLSKLLFKKRGLAAGDDVESILTRTEVLLEEGDLDSAAREMNGLQGWAKTLSRDWLGEVRKVLEVQQALDVIATEARLQSLRVE